MYKKAESFSAFVYFLFAAAAVATVLLCVCAGSVNIPLPDTLAAIFSEWTGQSAADGAFSSIILSVRLPRVLCAALVGASLSLCGACMQGLLRNPLADCSTLGVSSGASLGAVLSITLGIAIPGAPFSSSMIMAMLFAFLSLAVIIALSYKLDSSLSTNTIILTGVIFSMFASSVISFLITFSGEKLRSVTFWTMGSLARGSFTNVLTLLVFLTVFGAILLRYAPELNAFAIGEDNARNIGVNVKKAKLVIMISVSCLTGVGVAIGGGIGFVGLVIPHMTRMITGPNHKRLLSASMFSGAIFLMLADLAGRCVLRPLELPIGAVTSFIGSAAFIYIFYNSRKVK